MVEFALVLPIFLLLVMGILDFGFLFYNYISMENAARNAARVACVEYSKVAYDIENKVSTSPRVLELPATDADVADSYSATTYTSKEIELCQHVARSLEHTGIDKTGRKVTVTYTYDTSELANNDGWDLKSRYEGDVVVKVEGDAHVLTPVLGITADHMKKPLTSSAVYKVERRYD